MNSDVAITDDPRVDQSSWAYHSLTNTDLDHSPRTNPRIVNGSANVNPLDDLILVTATATLTLESPVGCDGRKHTFANTGSGTMTVASGANIDGAGNIATGTQYDVIAVESTGTTWKLLFKTVAQSSATQTSYTQIATHTVSGTEATISFTGISSEDIIIYTNGLKGDGSDSLQVAVSIDNGSTYGTPRDISAGGTIGGTAIYGSAFATGLKCGHMVIVGGKPSTTAPGINSGANLSAVNNSLAQFTTAAQINALRFSQVTGSNFTLGTLSLLGR